MSRSIKNGEPLLGSLKRRSAYLDRLTLMCVCVCVCKCVCDERCYLHVDHVDVSSSVQDKPTLSLSSWLVSSAQDKYHVSLFFSLASRSYFSKVRLSTCPVRYLGEEYNVHLYDNIKATTYTTIGNSHYMTTNCGLSSICTEEAKNMYTCTYFVLLKG